MIFYTNAPQSGDSRHRACTEGLSLEALGEKVKKSLKNRGPEALKSRPGGTKIEAQRRPKQGYPISPGGIGSWGALGIVLEASRDRLGGLLGRLGPKKVANMGPTWRPKRSKNR